MLYITGDTHGCIRKWKEQIHPVLKAEDTIIVAGDFGVGGWKVEEDASVTEEQFYDWISKQPYSVLFVDGNHENFDKLYAYPVEMWMGGNVHKLRPNLIHLMRGEVYEIDGKKIFDMNESEMAIFRRRNIGIVYQFYNLIPNLTVDENIMLPCLLDQRKPDAGKLERIVEMTGLSNRRKHLPGQLSGGQQQRVSVGRALIHDPAFILADEPTGNLDSRSGREVIELLMAANRKSGQTLILITHDENIALQANRILTISDGRIIRDEVIRG